MENCSGAAVNEGAPTPVFPPRNLLAPIDFSRQSIPVARAAAAFARRFDARLTLLHVAPLFPDANPGTLRQWLDIFAAEELGDLPVERVLLCSDRDIVSEIVGYAANNHTDLILMPTHGHGPFRRFLFGSVTLKVLHDARCAIWTATHTEHLAEFREMTIRKVISATDLSDHSIKALHWAAELAKAYAAELLIVYAVPVTVPPFLTPAGWEYMYHDWQKQLINSSKQKVHEIEKGLTVAAKVEVMPGPPAEVVRRAAENAHADLLVIGRSVDPRLLGRLWTHAYPIIRESPCPVISV